MEHINIPQSVIDILELLHTKTEKAYLVGGCVRDMFMHLEPHDYDICSDLTPDVATKVLSAKYPVIPKGIEYGTVVALVDGIEYEVTTFRGETDYSDGRHPDSVKFVSNIEDDLARRDFTINAMAYDMAENKVVDPFGGLMDLKNGILRAVGDANERFLEDGLRIMRALRFAIKYNLTIEPATKEAIIRNRNMLQQVSKERITSEFQKILTCGQPIRSTFLEFAPVIAVAIPEIKPCIGLDQENPYHKHDVYEHMLAVTDLCDTDSFAIKMAALLHDIGKPATKVYNNAKDHYSFNGHPEISEQIAAEVLANDFRCTAKENERIRLLVKFHDTQILPTEPCVKRWLNRYGSDFLSDWLVLKQADRDDHVYPNGLENVTWYPKTEDIKCVMDTVLEQQSAFSLKDLAINGRDLIDLGLKPGPEFSEYLQSCLDAVIDGACENEHDALFEYLETTYGFHLHPENNTDINEEDEFEQER